MSPHSYAHERKAEERIQEAHFAGYRQCLGDYWTIEPCDCGNASCDVAPRRLKHPLVIQPCHCGDVGCLEVAYVHDGSDDFTDGLHYLGHVPPSAQLAARDLTAFEVLAPEMPESGS